MLRGDVREWLTGAAMAGSMVAAAVVAITSPATASSHPTRVWPHLSEHRFLRIAEEAVALGPVTTDVRRGPTTVQVSCVGLTRPQQRAGANVIVVGTMLPGPFTRVRNRRVLLSPARMRVTRYLKGSGARTVEVQTGVRVSNGQIEMVEDGILPSAGQRWEILSASSRPPLQSSTCLGSRRLPASKVPGPAR